MLPYEALANAIIEQAARDWRQSARKLRKNPDNQAALWMKKDCERFFLSDWFSVLSNLDGAVILEKLREVYGT